MDSILLLKEKVDILIKAYKEQSLLVEEMQLKIDDLELSLSEKNNEINRLNKDLEHSYLTTSIDTLDQQEQKTLKKQLEKLIEQIDNYITQLK